MIMKIAARSWTPLIRASIDRAEDAATVCARRNRSHKPETAVERRAAWANTPEGSFTHPHPRRITQLDSALWAAWSLRRCRASGTTSESRSSSVARVRIAHSRAAHGGVGNALEHADFVKAGRAQSSLEPHPSRALMCSPHGHCSSTVPDEEEATSSRAVHLERPADSAKGLDQGLVVGLGGILQISGDQ